MNHDLLKESRPNVGASSNENAISVWGLAPPKPLPFIPLQSTGHSGFFT